MAKNRIEFFVNGDASLDVTGLVKGVKTAQDALEKLELSPKLSRDMARLTTQIDQEATSLQRKMSAGFFNLQEIKDAQKQYQGLVRLLKDYEVQVNAIGATELKLGKNTTLAKELTEASKALETLKSEAGTLDSLFGKGLGKAVTERFRHEVQAQKDIILELVRSGKDVSGVFEQIAAKEFDVSAFKQLQDDVEKTTSALEKAQAKIAHLDEDTRKTILGFSEKATRRIGLENTLKEIETLSTVLKEQKATLKSLSPSLEKLESNYDSAIKRFQKFIVDLQNATSAGNEVRLDYMVSDLEEMQEVFNGFSGVNLLAANDILDAMGKEIQEVSAEVPKLEESLSNKRTFGEGIEEANRQMNALEQSMLRFFSLSNGWNIVQKAMRSAFNVVKDLDAEMTEIAVVTDMSLDQVWAMRNQYSKAATDMGAATLDMVAASKLYYQQGLSQIEVVQASTETIKMARIANLDGARATDLMTAAVRGFGMEMSEASRINDVYSWLAAKSAADTLEIADAMTRTASIAHSANATFENTAAFLTQMINMPIMA